LIQELNVVNLTSDAHDEHTLEEWNIENLEVAHPAIEPAV
jgi:hypothetical protein